MKSTPSSGGSSDAAAADSAALPGPVCARSAWPPSAVATEERASSGTTSVLDAGSTDGAPPVGCDAGERAQEAVSTNNRIDRTLIDQLLCSRERSKCRVR